MKNLVLLVAGMMLAGCATAPPSKPDPRDPWERFNRASFKVNDALDRAILRPTARAYVKVAPRVLRTGVSNFFDNLETVTTLVNDALQGKLAAAGHDSARFLLNSTLGLAGLFDPATAAGIDKNDEDFGQTLGKWGVKSGPYLMVPLFGPSTLRDLPARGVDTFTDPSHYLEDDSTRYSITGVEIVDLRAGLLDLDDQLKQSFDRYAFVRNAWLQRRDYKVKDGDVADESFDEDAMMNEEPTAKDEKPPETQ
ncbi:MAG TPA: VacJ family lipoprotein [Steroidobacteraceae bacterium]|nr:VacJ family lipoprotein [Steroidobacteraceae bacterium]